ncbi:MAG: hypothetical protein Q7T54_04900 [Candidatus Levybacteria bacterium]|nr:hypothetical protein [Candidatus Levybacteria bacterium]
MADQPKVNIKVKVADQVRPPLFANVVNITTTSEGDVFLDFVSVHPSEKDQDGSSLGTLVSRIVLQKNVAKDLQLILNAHLGQPKKE